MRTAWGRDHQQWFALIDGSELLASAKTYRVAGVFEQRHVRICGIGAVFTEPMHLATREPSSENCSMKPDVRVPNWPCSSPPWMRRGATETDSRESLSMRSNSESRSRYVTGLP